jgi:hypothetical protein
VDEVHVKLYLQITEAGYILAMSELNKDILLVFEGPVAATGKKLQPNWTQLEKTGNSVAVAGFS